MNCEFASAMNEVQLLGAMLPEVFIGAVVVAKPCDLLPPPALDLPWTCPGPALDLRDELSAILHAR
jgi:hypothetical protein